MNIESQQTTVNTQQPKQSVARNYQYNQSGSFANELKSTKNSMQSKKESEAEENEAADISDKSNIDDAIDGLEGAVEEINSINQKEESVGESVKNNENLTDKKDNKEVLGLIDNNFNIQEKNEQLIMQMGAGMNFNSNEQPFSQLMNNDKNSGGLNSSVKDLAEENAILSTMEENIAIANKNIALNKTKVVENEHGIVKVDTNSNLTVDIIASYDNVIMDKADVEFFTNLVNNEQINIANIQNGAKSSQVSQTLADLLAKAMNENKPIRIDFDNNISVIIKIDRAGKISADFLPSSQVAEAYLKENLPLLKQRFDDNNIDYNELNQRQRKQEQQEQENRKKGRKDE